MTITQQMGLGVILGLYGVVSMGYSFWSWEREKISARLFLAFQMGGVGSIGAGMILVFIGFARLAT